MRHSVELSGAPMHLDRLQASLGRLPRWQAHAGNSSACAAPIGPCSQHLYGLICASKGRKRRCSNGVDGPSPGPSGPFTAVPKDSDQLECLFWDV